MPKQPVTFFEDGRLGDLEVVHFLENYWQKKPCILRQVLNEQQRQLFSVDELAGFALEDDIDSRLVLGRAGEQSSAQIKVSHGPFSEETLSTLPEQDWTLLLQSMDIWEPQFQSFLNWVNFIPRWRLDDIMVSIAAPGGGVGPHRDQYDVFLIQCEGERRWQVAPPCSVADDYSVTDLVQVAPFKAEIDEVLQAGDVLYLPPAWLHWGVAKTLTVTCSIGFRAPSANDLMISLSDQLVERQTDAKRFTDKWRKASHKMNISSADIREVREKLTALLKNDLLLAEALGKQVTQAKFSADDFAEETEQDFSFQPNKNYCLQLHPASRMSYFVTENESLQIYFNGETSRLKTGDFIEPLLDSLCAHQTVDTAELDAENSEHQQFFKFLEAEIINGCIQIL